MKRTKTEMINIRLTKEDKDKIVQAAYQQRRSITGFITYTVLKRIKL